MSKWIKYVSALLVAALLMALCLPPSLAEGDPDDTGLDIEYETIEPDDADSPDIEDDDEDGTPMPAGAESLEGTGLTLDDGPGDPAPSDGAVVSQPDVSQTEGDPDGDPGEENLSPVTVELPEPGECVIIPEGGLDSEEALTGFINKTLYEQPIQGRATLRAAFANTAGNHLTGADLRLYNILKPLVIEVAKGQRSNTEFLIPVNTIYEKSTYTAADLGLSSLYGDDGQPSEEAKSKFKEKYSPDVQKVMSALLADCPYELFWFDKAGNKVQKIIGGIIWTAVNYQFSGDTILIRGYDFPDDLIVVSDYATGQLRYRFTVSSDYSSTGAQGTFETNATLIASIQTAAQNASKIINDCYSYQDDLDKLTYYKNEVCSRVDYNYDADSNIYGDPWQIIWVFDGDESTNVVCEGYAKAFQFLCDQTNFINDITVLLVHGGMFNESTPPSKKEELPLHMWNLVNYGGKNYLVDLTNCDENTAGYPDQLFMKGYSSILQGWWGDAYRFPLKNNTLCYVFDENIVNLYGQQTLQVSNDITGPTTQGQALGNSGLAWSLSTAGVLYIRGKGAIPNFTASGDAPWAGDSVKHVTLSNGVTTIGDNAFTGCPNLTQVTIPPSVTSISDSAFDPSAMRGNCKGLIIQTCKSQSIIEYAKRLQLNYTVNHGLAATDKTEEAVGATCTETGWTQGSHCSICNEVIVQRSIVPATGHSWGTWQTTQAATCTKAGTKERTCTKCKVKDTPQSIPATGHSLTATAAKAATCSATGNIAYWTCSSCKKYFKDKDGKSEITQAQTVIAKNASNHTGGTELRNQKAATCKEAGYTGDTYCKGCNAKLASGKSIAKLTTHTPKAAVKEKVVVETCGKAGSYDSVVYCSVCGVELSREQKTVAATGSHSFSAWKTTKAATCVAAGSQSRSCSVCGKTETQSIPATGVHTFSAWKTTKAATCVAAGTQSRSCSVCGKTETQSIPATGVHTFSAWATTQAATCTAAGTQSRSCSVCGKTETQSIPATGHSPETIWGYGPTCTENGLTNGARCAVCGAILVAHEIIPAYGHSPVYVPGYPATYTTEGLTDGAYCAICNNWLVWPQAIPRVYIRQVGLAKQKNNGTIQMSVGESLMLVPQFAQDAQVAVTGYTSSKANLATVDGAGIVTALAEGKVKITVATGNKKVKATLTIKIVDPYKPTGVSIAQGKAVAIAVGQPIQLIANLAPETARATLTWSSSKPKVATVDANGVVVPQGEGKARITVTTHNKKKASINVTVVDPYKPTAVGIAQGKAVTVAMGQPIQLIANLAPETARATLAWTSSKPKVATVDANGVVVPQGEGTARITVTTHNKKKASINVTVVDPNKPAGVSIAQGKAVTLAVGQALHLDAVLAPASAQSALTWKSGKPAVAAVDGAGNVTALKKGKAKITVMTYNKKKAIITVNVVE